MNKMKKCILLVVIFMLSVLVFAETNTYYSFRFSYPLDNDDPVLTFVYYTRTNTKKKETIEYALVHKGPMSNEEILTAMDKLHCAVSSRGEKTLQRLSFDVAKSDYKYEGKKAIYYIYDYDVCFNP